MHCWYLRYNIAFNLQYNKAIVYTANDHVRFTASKCIGMECMRQSLAPYSNVHSSGFQSFDEEGQNRVSKLNICKFLKKV